MQWMDTVLGCLGIVFLVLLEPVTMAYAVWYARKRGWIHGDWKHCFTALAVYRGAGADCGLYCDWPVLHDHGQDAAGDILDDGESVPVATAQGNGGE